MRSLLLVVLVAGCDARALDAPPEPLTTQQDRTPPCCEKYPGRPVVPGQNGQADLWVCKNIQCPELQAGSECTTLSDTKPTYCQVPVTDDCKIIYLEDVRGEPFQTIYCF